MENTIELPEGKEECPICDGKGEALFSCCTGDRVDSDFGRCPECKEGLGESKCEECNGTGLVDIEAHVEAPVIIDPVGAAELSAEDRHNAGIIGLGWSLD